jgi:cytochrome c-type biogenesis protein CcmH/NrfG
MDEYYIRAFAYFMIKDYDKAAADFETVLKNNPTDSRATAMLQIIRKRREDTEK